MTPPLNTPLHPTLPSVVYIQLFFCFVEPTKLTDKQWNIFPQLDRDSQVEAVLKL